MGSFPIPKASLGSCNNSIPLIGFGTATYPFGANSEVILDAIETGYRHFDTASCYESEKPLGEAIREALRRGLIKSRDELFVTSKLWCCDGYADRVLPAIQTSLRNLGLEYLDLYLIHLPISSKEPGEYNVPKKENLKAMDFKSTWEAMEECQKLGLTRSIGVSNFSSKKLSDLLSVAKKIPPAVNQVEMNPLWRQQKLREFCSSKGIHITAYSPLGAKGTPWGGNNVMDSEVLKEIAEAKGKTVAQVALRWLYEQGVSFVVKSFNKERMKENLKIFDWELSQEESQKINQIPQCKGNLCLAFVSENGPYKTIEELFDGEV